MKTTPSDPSLVERIDQKFRSRRGLLARGSRAWALWLPCLILLTLRCAGLGQTYSVINTNASGAGSLVDAIAQANSGSYNVIDIQSGLGSILLSTQMIVNANVTINGNANTIDMGNSDRAFFLAGGTININDLTIQNGNATGGSGTDGGGGGAGLGGAIFVANGPAINSGITSAANVTLTNVQFSSNAATGGAGSGVSPSGWGGGGGGMGGEGGFAVNAFYSGGGGGGGFGNNATGGDSNSGGTGDGGQGAFYPGFSNPGMSGGVGAAGNFGETGGYGGSDGGGGGGAYASISSGHGGGGGGVGGDNGDANGGNGGFGGGGGGAENTSGALGGNGGFGGGGGGGGGGGENGQAGNGGFGGGGGQGNNSGVGGFGAGSPGGGSGGGGGLGAGGAIFVMAGSTLNIIDSSFVGSGVTGGTGNTGGSAVGADLFLGANTIVTVSGTNSQTMNALGGAGNSSDPNISGNASDPNAQGGLTKQGTGGLTLIGNNYYTGSTVINQGALTFGNNALGQGSAAVIVGQNNGDNATLNFGNSAMLNLAGFTGPSGTDAPIMLGQNAGATGAINIGNGAGSSGAYLGLREITGGAGGGTLNFNQELDAAGVTSDYQFLTTITGNVTVTQNGPGITTLNPLYGANTYTGGTVITSGTLLAQAVGTLGSGGVTVSGGLLAVAGDSAITNTVTLSGGTYAVQVIMGESYADAADATSEFGNGRSTAASILSGTSSAGTQLQTSFAASTGAVNDGLRVSDAYSFVGTNGDIFVLELSMSAVSSSSILGWLDDETNLWVFANAGNTDNNASGGELGFAGTFANFQLTYGYDITQYVGAYGVDVASDSVWAVLNHNSDFAVLAVPEPATTSLLLGAAALALIWKMRRAKFKSKNHENANRHI